MRRMRTVVLSFGLIACGDSSATPPEAPADVDASSATPNVDASTPPPEVDASPPAPEVDASSTGTPPHAAAIPQPTGACPELTDGDVTFAPAGLTPRRVKLSLPPATAPGPLILYWHATGSSPLEAGYALGATERSFVASGGIVAAPYSDPTAGTFEWFIVNQSLAEDDFLLADEIVACLAEAGRLDPAHVHSMGMSAGALQTTAMGFFRSSYIASVATFSGGMPDGFPDPASQDPDNLFAALIFDGGPDDRVFGVDFQAASERYRETLSSAGHFAAICSHGMGHSIPLDAAPSVVAFFAANGFGAWPSPYASTGLPESFPSYCAR